MLLPAGNDDTNLKTNGEFYLAIKDVSPESETVVEFEDMLHGWLIRGDQTDENIKVKIELALTRIHTFLAKHI